MVSLVSFLVRRILQGVLIILLVSFGIFAVLRLVPGDPARLVLMPMASDHGVEAAAPEMGLRDSIAIQYVHWLGAALHDDLGQSYIRALNVSQVAESQVGLAQAGK